MKKLIGELNVKCKKFSLKYLLFEEFDIEICDMLFFSLLIELLDGKHNEFAQVRNFTNDRIIAEQMLCKICFGKVTPIGLPYIIEDFIAES
jgi:hypothetical protein